METFAIPERLGGIAASPTRLEGMETKLHFGQYMPYATSPTRLEGMETSKSPAQSVRASLSPTRLEGMETKTFSHGTLFVSTVSDPP